MRAKIGKWTIAIALTAVALAGCKELSQKERALRDERALSERRQVVAPRLEHAQREHECEQCNLSYAVMTGSDFSEGRFHGAAMAQVEGHGVNFRDADLSASWLGGDFSESDFRGANLDGAQFEALELRNARMDGIDFRNVSNLDAAIWLGTWLEGANFEGKWFWGRGGHLHRTTPGNMFAISNGGTDLSGAHLRGANLRGAKFSGCRMRDVDLRDADLTGASLSTVDLRGADLRGANLDRVRMIGTELEGANLEGASIRRIVLGAHTPESQARLEGAIWVDGTTCEPGSIGRCVHPRRSRGR